MARHLWWVTNFFNSLVVYIEYTPGIRIKSEMTTGSRIDDVVQKNEREPNYQPAPISSKWLCLLNLSQYLTSIIDKLMGGLIFVIGEFE